MFRSNFLFVNKKSGETHSKERKNHANEVTSRKIEDEQRLHSSAKKIISASPHRSVHISAMPKICYNNNTFFLHFLQNITVYELDIEFLQMQKKNELKIQHFATP